MIQILLDKKIENKRIKKTKGIIKFTEHLLLGLIIFTLFLSTTLYIKSYAFGANICLWLLLIVITTDVFAYFGGLLCKGPKLAPRISPGKHISGAIIAVISSIIVGHIFRFLIQDLSTIYNHVLITSCLLSIISQIGDLWESSIKRKYNIKDSGKILLGHGGLFDRVDGLIFVIISFGFYLYKFC